MTDTIAPYRAARSARRPHECHFGQPCWVDTPYQCTSTKAGGVRCTSCGGAIAWWDFEGAPPADVVAIREELIAAE